ncbi:hypothetical protein GCM10027360_64380 [Amycolatopsis echigonensis]
MRWPYTETVPSSCRTRTHSPNPLAGPASITVPESGAFSLQQFERRVRAPTTVPLSPDLGRLYYGG